MDSRLIEVDTTAVEDHGVAVVTLNRPHKKNALSHAMRLDLAHAFEALAHDARVVVLTGHGDVFCAGFDLAEFDRVDGEGLWESSNRMNAVIAAHPVPVIAALDGPVVAGGADLAVLTDIRLGTPRTSFSHPEHRRFPVVYGPLAECIGSTRARELVLTGRTVDADEALAVGLLTEIVRDRRVLDRACELAYDIARTPWHLLHRMRRKFQQFDRYDPACHTLSL
ncbi:enoyl-CoA hydratase/isomerase family protein [Rhodococcus sp. B50]|uniref:enoyl-CoA hydratase/isomerase family protein n=1 Tax=Rhodococcus sp. B50 TaxID=2682847 RepID=UPI0019E197B0|nr:enoyl-CoA hydratase/isomerase family protein [Rhodococcus sp. B50]MBS9372315.1 Methylthioacryloyl-CoA hydratase [Rhodococcus sp. B50]